MPKKTPSKARAEPSQDREQLLRCPKCAAPMQPVVFQGTEVDRCTGCQGLWFDLLEHQDLKEPAGSESIDLGEAYKGRDMNKVDDIECPVCHARMVRLVDREQRHIRYEACSTCYGVFFDAGEFRDWKKHHAFDWLKSLVARERK